MCRTKISLNAFWSFGGNVVNASALAPPSALLAVAPAVLELPFLPMAAFAAARALAAILTSAILTDALTATFPTPGPHHALEVLVLEVEVELLA